jgi:hypothetical protein
MAIPGTRLAAVILALLAANGLLAWLTLRGQDVTVGPEAVAQAAERTSTSEGLRFSLTGQMEVPDAGSVTFTGTGVSDLRGRRGAARMDMSELAQQAGAPGAAAAGDWTMEIVFNRSAFYMKFPPLAPALEGKSWMKFDLQRVSQALGVDSEFLRSEQQGGDPTTTLRYLRAVSGDVEELGTEQVRGVETTRYRTTVDLRRYPELLPEAEREQARRSIDRVIELAGDDSIEAEVWVGKGLIRRISWDQSVRVQGTDQVVDASFTADYYDFGARVAIEPPPAGDVKDLTEAITAQLSATL